MDKASHTVRRIREITQPEWVHVEPHNIGQAWDSVLPGLMKVWRHTDGWRVEDVYVALKTGSAYLHLALLDGKYSGFVVAQPQNAPDGAVLHLWALYAEDGNREHFVAWLEQIDQWARNIKAKRITFHSPRKGWEKLGHKLGFEPGMTIFERTVL